jgi:hypothetical protein
MPLSNHALTIIDTIKSELEIPLSYTDEDSYIERLINSVSEAIKNYCSRDFEKRTEAEKIQGSGRRKLFLCGYPIISITEIKINDEILSSEEYELTEEGKSAGYVYKEDRWPVSIIGSHGIVTDPIFSDEKHNIEVTYETGYVLPKDETEENPRTLPYDLEDCCVEAVAARYAQRGTGGNIKSYKEEYISVTFDEKTGLPINVLQKLKNSGYVRVV